MRSPHPWLLLATLALSACGAGPDAGAGRFLSIGTGGTGGIYYPLGGALASRLSQADSVRQYTAEVSGGSVENVNRVANGDIDLGFAIGTTVSRAYHGAEGEEGAPTLRIVAPLYPNMTHILVAGDSPARSLADLAGARISVGAPGSGTEQVSRQLLEAHGLTYDDIEPRYLSFTESSAALRDGAIDVAILSVGYPASAVLEAVTNGDVRLLPVDPAVVDRMTARYPYYTPGTIPAGTYPGQDGDLPTVGVMNWIVADEGLDATVVTRLLDVLRDDRDYLAQVHEITRQVDLSALSRAPIPLHPATRRWLEGS